MSSPNPRVQGRSYFTRVKSLGQYHPGKNVDTGYLRLAPLEFGHRRRDVRRQLPIVGGGRGRTWPGGRGGGWPHLDGLRDHGVVAGVLLAHFGAVGVGDGARHRARPARLAADLHSTRAGAERGVQNGDLGARCSVREPTEADLDRAAVIGAVDVEGGRDAIGGPADPDVVVGVVSEPEVLAAPAGHRRIAAVRVVADVQRMIVPLDDLKAGLEHRVEERGGDLADAPSQDVLHLAASDDAGRQLVPARRRARSDGLVEVVHLPGGEELVAGILRGDAYVDLAVRRTPIRFGRVGGKQVLDPHGLGFLGGEVGL